MQEKLLEDKGLVCDHCRKHSKDHTYHQIMTSGNNMMGFEYPIYLCTKCYKAGKANEFK